MNQRELVILGVTALAGVVAAIIVYMATGDALVTGLTSTYVDIHVVVLFCCLGCLAIVGRYTKKAQSRLIATFSVTSGLIGVILFWSGVGQPTGIVLYAVAGVVGAGIVAIMFSVDMISDILLYRLTALLCCSLFTFALIYSSLLTVQNGSLRFIIPLLVVVPIFVVVIKTLASEPETVI